MLPKVVPEGQNRSQIRTAFRRVNSEILPRLSHDGKDIELYESGGLTTGRKRTFVLRETLRIGEVILLAPTSGDVTLDLLSGTYEDWPTLTSICGSAQPEMTSAQKAKVDQETINAEWDNHLKPGTILSVDIDSVSSLERLTINLHVERE